MAVRSPIASETIQWEEPWADGRDDLSFRQELVHYLLTYLTRHCQNVLVSRPECFQQIVLPRRGCIDDAGVKVTVVPAGAPQKSSHRLASQGCIYLVARAEVSLKNGLKIRVEMQDLARLGIVSREATFSLQHHKAAPCSL